jgi:hypothetical protein
MYPSNWQGTYNLEFCKTHNDLLQSYVNLLDEHEWVHDARMSMCGRKMMLINRIDYIYGHNSSLEEFPDTYTLKDGFGNVLETYDIEEVEYDYGYTNVRIYCHIIDLSTNQVEHEFILADEKWYDYFKEIICAEYPVWEPYTAYTEGDIVRRPRYNILIVCKRDHTSSSSLDYNQGGIDTWDSLPTSTYPYSWWEAEDYISSTAAEEWDEYAWFTGCFDDENDNIIYLFSDYTKEVLKINTENNNVENINLQNFDHLFDSLSLGSPDKLVGKYQNYFIFTHGNSYLFFNTDTNKWFSLVEDFSDETDNTIDFYVPYYFKLGNGILQNNRLYIKFDDVDINDDVYYGIKEINIDNIENTISTFKNLETDLEKNNFVANYFNSIPTYRLDDFDSDDYDIYEDLCFNVGRDNNIYISGPLNSDIYKLQYEDYLFNNQFQLRIYDKNMNLLNTVATGSLYYPIGMDFENSLHITQVGYWIHSIRWNCSLSNYYFYMYNYMKFKPVLNPTKQLPYEKNDNIQSIQAYNINYMEWDENPLYRNFVYETYVPAGSLAIMSSNGEQLFIKQYTNYSGLYNDEAINHIYKYDTSTEHWNNISKNFIPYNNVYNEAKEDMVSVGTDIYLLIKYGYIIKFNEKDGYTRISSGFYDTLSEASAIFTTCTMNYYNDKLYIIGSFTDTENPVWEYNIKTDIWIPKSTCPSGTTRHASTIIGYKIYVVFDVELWEYNIKTDTWTQKADFIGSTTEYYRQNLATTYQNKLYYYQSGILYEYDPLADTWSIIDDSSSTMPSANNDDKTACLKIANGALYLYYTYRTYSSNINKLYKYDFSTNAWEEKSLQLCSSLPGKNIDFTTTVTSIREVRGEEVIVPYPVESIDTVCISYTVTITNNDSTHTTKVCIEIGDTFPIAWAMLADGVYVDNYGVPWHTIDLGPNESKEVTLLVGGPCYDDPRCYFPQGINPTIAIASDFSEVTLHFTYVVEYNAETVPDDYTLALYGPDGPLRASDFGAV